MQNRELIDVFGPPIVIMTKMAEGNPGAATVLGEIMKARPDTWRVYVGHLDDMNIRGSQIWIAYKDYCGRDIEKFFLKIGTRDADMIAMINERSGISHRAYRDRHDPWPT